MYVSNTVIDTETFQKKERFELLGMGWLQSVGSSKFQVSFAEYTLFYRALLQRRPLIFRSLLILATAYALFPSVYHNQFVYGASGF